MNRTARLFLTAALTGMLTACAGQKTFDYDAQGPQNLTAFTDKTTKRWLSKRHLNIALHHQKPEKPCEWNYVGTLLLDEKKTRASLPVGKPMLIQFNFLEYARLNQGGRHVSTNRLFTAQPGNQYELVMAFDDNATYYEVFEINKRTGQRRSLDLKSPPRCSA